MERENLNLYIYTLQQTSQEFSHTESSWLHLSSYFFSFKPSLKASPTRSVTL